jgi:hypothetical protein
MTLQLSLISTSLVLFGLVCPTSLMLAQAEAPFSSSAATPGGSVETRASTTESPVPVPTYSLAPYEQRLAAAQSVKVMTAILGLELGSTLKQAHARGRRRTFHGLFYGLKIFGCKTAQSCVTRCKPHWLGLPMIRNAVQRSENVRNSLGLNYKSAALDQLSYAGLPDTKAVFTELIKRSS